MSSAAQTTRLYEAMFLVDSNKANQDWERVTSAIHSIITRHGGEVAKSELWDNERKLAYRIGYYSKATFILIHFNVEPARIKDIRHEYELSDQVIRVMILVDVDGLSSEIRSLSDDPTDPVRSRSKSRDVNVPTSSRAETSSRAGASSRADGNKAAEDSEKAPGDDDSVEESAAEASTETAEASAETAEASAETAEASTETAESSEEESSKEESNEAPAESDESSLDADSGDVAADKETAGDEPAEES
jgi:ribosomal protein S6